MLYCEVLVPRWNTRCVWLCLAGLSTAMMALRLLAVETSLIVQFVATLCWSLIQVLTTMSGGLFLNGCIVQMMPSLLLIGLSRGMCSSTSLPERLIGNSLIFLRLQSMYSFKCLSILTVTKIGDCDLWRRARLQIKKNFLARIQMKSNEQSGFVISLLWVVLCFQPQIAIDFESVRQVLG